MAALKKIGEGTNYVLYEDDRGNKLIRLDKVRLSYPFIGTPGEDTKDDGSKEKKWRVQAMLPKATHKAAKDAVKAIIMELMAKADGGNGAKGIKVPQERWFLSDGDAKADEDSKYEAMRDHFLVAASDGRIRPSARDQKGQLMDDIAKIDEKFYGGCWGNVLIRPWFFDGKSKKAKDGKVLPKRIVAGLTGVQFWKDDKPFGSGRIDDTEAWDSVDDGDDDGMGDDDDGL